LTRSDLSLSIRDLAWSRILSWNHSHDLVAKLLEQSTLEWLRRLVTNHVPRGTPDYRHFVFTNTIGNKKIPNVNVLRALTARSFSVGLQENRTLVVLEKDVILDIVTLGLHKISGPADCRHEVVSSHNFCFCGAAGVELLLG
jgi:hypothetical protein